MEKHFEYAISFAEVAPMTAPLPLSGNIYENLHAATALGYAGLELHMRENAPLEVEKIKDVSARCAGRITAVATGRLYTQGKLSLLDDAVGIAQAAEQGMRKYVDLANSLETPDLVLGLAKGMIPHGGNRELYLRRLAEQLHTLSDYARPKGVRIQLEAINRYEVNLFNTAEDICQFLEEYDLDNCFVHLDTFHMNIEESDPITAIHRCGNRLGYFHVADNTRRCPGSGQLDFSQSLAALRDIGYKGYITVECLPDVDRLGTAKKAIEHLRKCEELLQISTKTE